MKNVFYPLIALALCASSCSKSSDADLNVSNKVETGKVKFNFFSHDPSANKTSRTRSSMGMDESSNVYVSAINIKAMNILTNVTEVDENLDFSSDMEMSLPYGNYDINSTTVSDAPFANKFYDNIDKQETVLDYTNLLTKLQPISAEFTDKSELLVYANLNRFVQNIRTIHSRCNLVFEPCQKYDVYMSIRYDGGIYTEYQAVYPKSVAYVLNEYNLTGNKEIQINLKKYLHGSYKLLETVPVYSSGTKNFETTSGVNTTIVIKMDNNGALTYVKNGFGFTWTPMGEDGVVINID